MPSFLVERFVVTRVSVEYEADDMADLLDQHASTSTTPDDPTVVMDLGLRVRDDHGNVVHDTHAQAAALLKMYEEDET